MLGFASMLASLVALGVAGLAVALTVRCILQVHEACARLDRAATALRAALAAAESDPEPDG